MSDLTDSEAYYDWLDEVLGDPDACPSCGGELFKIEEHRSVVCCARCGGIINEYDGAEFDPLYSMEETIGGES